VPLCCQLAITAVYLLMTQETPSQSPAGHQSSTLVILQGFALSD